MSTVLQVSQGMRRAPTSWYSDHDSEGAWERSADELAFQIHEGEDDDGRWDDEPDWEDDDWEWEDDGEGDEDDDRDDEE